MGVEIVSSGLKINGELVPFISGAFQYWRSKRQYWEKIFDLILELGFEFVETYIPWSVHEIEEEKFDFESQEKNLARFLELAGKKGFKVLVRPGPHINAELTYFGYPRRLLERKECLSRSADGDLVWLPVPPKMFPVPSYASEAFYEEVRRWYQAVGGVLKPYLYPEGSVVMVQVDNEFCNFFRSSPYDHDYHPDAIRLWHSFLREKYKDVSRLNFAYGKKFSSFDQIEPARSFSAQSQKELVYFLDWVEFREFYMQNALRRLKGLLEEAGIKDIVFMSNYPLADDYPPNNFTELERFLDFQGLDMYPQRRQWQGIKRLARTACGLSRFACSPEFSSGAFIFNPPISLSDQRFTTPYLLMHGIKGVNFYMLVERERWYGSPITHDARVRREYFEFFKKLVSFLKSSRIFELKKYASCLVLTNRDYDRLECATTLLDPLPLLSPQLTPPEFHCSEERFGFEQAIQLYARNFFEAIYRALDRAGAGLNLGNTTQELESLRRYKLVALCTFEFLNAQVQRRLRDYVKQGGFLVLGPKLPELDEQMEPCEILKQGLEIVDEVKGELRAKVFQLGKGRLVLIPHNFDQRQRKHPPEPLVKLMRRLLELAGAEPRYKMLTPGAEVELHEGNGREVIFVANPRSQAIQAKIKLASPGRFKDLESGKVLSGADELEIELLGWQVRVLERENA